jgi:hypothetical protein
MFSNAMTMNQRCPYCGMDFEREPGFYSGAVYLGLMIATPIVIGILCGLLLLLPELPPQWPALFAVFFYIPLTPLTVRFSRVLWLNIGGSFAPSNSGGSPPPPPTGPPKPIAPSSPDGATRRPDEHEPLEQEARVSTRS